MADTTTSEEKLDKLGVIPVFLRIALAFDKHLITGPFRGKDAPTTWRRDISYGVIREVVSGFSVLQGQWLSPGTDTVYKNVAKSNGWQPNSTPLESGAKGHWIGKPDAKYVMVYFHGGGYISASTPGHMKYQFDLQKAMAQLGYSFSIFSLSYTLAPHSVYPGQLRQAASALTYLLEYEKRDPSTILLGGDSAGANLVSVLLLHLARPHPLVPAVSLPAPLHAALLISPWVSFETDSTSFKRNARSDYLTKRALDRASSAYIGKGREHDTYSQPILAPAEWWRDIANKAVREIMVWGGGGEVLIDSIRTYAATIADGFAEADTSEAKGVEGNYEGLTAVNGREVNKKPVTKGRERVKFVETPRQAHEEMIIDNVIRIRGKGEGARAVEEWLSAEL